MNVIANISTDALRALVRRAADQLASATNAAEILDARDNASVVYDAAKKAARLAKAKGAHDELVAKAHRAQADALLIESEAKRRLADEYDAAQPDEARKGGRPKTVPDENGFTAAEVGLSRKDIHEARIIRDAEIVEPGIAQRALDARLAQGLEPTKAALREAVTEAAYRGLRGSPAPSNKNPMYRAPTKAGAAWSHFYGDCRLLVEWATDENILLALHGRAERTDDQGANERAIRRAAIILREFVETLDAQ